MGVKAEDTPEWATVRDPATPLEDLIPLTYCPWWAIRRAALARIPADQLPHLWCNANQNVPARYREKALESLLWEVVTRARARALPDPVAEFFLTHGPLMESQWARRVTRCQPDQDKIAHLSPLIIEAYLTHPDVWVQVNLAENPKTPDRYLERLAVGTDVLVRERLARCVITGPVLRLLAASNADGVWEGLATWHGDWFVEHADAALVARYASRTPRKDHLWLLAVHPDPQVRAAAAGNRHSGTELAVRLFTDPDPLVRVAAVTAGWAYSPDTVLPLLDDPDARVRRAAVTSRLPWWTWTQVQHLLTDPDPHVRARLPKISDIPPTALNTLATDAHAGVRRAASTRLLTAV